MLISVGAPEFFELDDENTNPIEFKFSDLLP
ncbi:Uncharacterised protein [Achromobacter sp. 2789STDY5608633]|nr:Uncharacterised protein [Achromobacter sp. 2789STDY5608633]